MAKCLWDTLEEGEEGQYPLSVLWKVTLGKGNQSAPTSKVTGPTEPEVLCSSQGRMVGPLCYNPLVLGSECVALGPGPHYLLCLVSLLETPGDQASELCKRTFDHSLTVVVISTTWKQTYRLRGRQQLLQEMPLSLFLGPPATLEYLGWQTHCLELGSVFIQSPYPQGF